VREQYDRQFDMMHKAVLSGRMEVARLRQELDTLREDNQLWMDTNLQLTADVVQYRGSWIAADHQVKQLTTQLKSISNSTPPHPPSTQPPMNKPLRVFSSKRARVESSPIESASGMDIEGDSSEVEIVHVHNNVRDRRC
jgi:hypothetical protein